MTRRDIILTRIGAAFYVVVILGFSALCIWAGVTGNLPR